MKPRKPLRTHWDRFIRNVAPGPVPEFDPSLGPCELWTGGKMKSGYGLFHSPSGLTAHRFAYEHAEGQLSEDFDVHHRCRVRLCVRRSHLQALTVDEHLAVHAENRPMAASGVRNVYAEGGKWYAKVTYRRVMKRGPWRTTVEEAKGDVIRLRSELRASMAEESTRQR